MEIYKTLRSQYTAELIEINKKYSSVSFARLMSILFFMLFIYLFISNEDNMYLFAAMALLALFFVLMRYHTIIGKERTLKQALVKINEDEIDYLSRKSIPFDNGVVYNDFTHPYAYDLDIYGEHSLFQNLNRTQTFIGRKTLAARLLKLLPNQEILKNQSSIKELASKLNWRQHFMALGKISNDTKASYETIIRWSRSASAPLSKETLVMSYVLPALLGGTFIAYLITSSATLLSVFSFLFVFNLSFTGKFFKRISNEIQNADNVDKIITQYSIIVSNIENEVFTSERLIELQQQLKKDKAASDALKQLSVLFSRMDSISNFVTTLLFNGLFLFHLHNLKALINWKKENADALTHWMDVIGEFELLNSLANFSYNNNGFAFPELNTEHHISFRDLSHPLLNPATRIGNDTAFQPQSFMILTGSNMSGKSTFLRSLGINMVLAGIGAPVCAAAANIHPMPVLVSMRLSDSLSDSESYFYAEIKRLKQIMDALQGQRAFVLLDEILRGTNSDDKRNGTIEVVKKIIGKNAIGAIATHDIEVCLTTNDYPEQLTNKCFEVEIINDDLHFDYKLRDGICKNRSATFLMKKMEII